MSILPATNFTRLSIMNTSQTLTLFPHAHGQDASSRSSSFSSTATSTETLRNMPSAPSLSKLLLYYPTRLAFLFLLGFSFAVIIDHLQTQHHITQLPRVLPSAQWVGPVCGFSAVFVGVLFPLADYVWGEKSTGDGEGDWSSVMRCIGGFIGVAYAATKLPWTSNVQVSCTLALISVVLWFLFDRTRHGFLLSLVIAILGTAAAGMLVFNGLYSFTQADFFGLRSWIPCILFSSSICFGTIGRQLAIVPEEVFKDRSFREIKRRRAQEEKRREKEKEE